MGEDWLDIPLFPLDIVLFPGMTLPLHIFEPRYREMTSLCLDTNTPFGVVLTLSDEGGFERPASVGTLARIQDYQRLPDGRYNLLTKGAERFEILEFLPGDAFQRARARIIHDQVEREDVSGLVSEAAFALRNYLDSLCAEVGSDECRIDIPTDPEDLSYLIGMCLTCEDCEKQEMLEIRSLATRLRRGAAVLRTETAALRDEGSPKGDSASSPDADMRRLN